MHIARRYCDPVKEEDCAPAPSISPVPLTSTECDGTGHGHGSLTADSWFTESQWDTHSTPCAQVYFVCVCSSIWSMISCPVPICSEVILFPSLLGRRRSPSPRVRFSSLFAIIFPCLDMFSAWLNRYSRGALAVCRCRITERVMHTPGTVELLHCASRWQVPAESRVLLLAGKGKWVSGLRMGVPGARAHKSHGVRLGQDDWIGIESCWGHSGGDSPVTATGIRVMFGTLYGRQSSDRYHSSPHLLPSTLYWLYAPLSFICIL